jgi:hypothetical protein
VDPKRAIDLIDKEEPRLEKSRTETEEPRRAKDLNEMEEPSCP